VAAGRLQCRSREGKESEWGRRRSAREEEEMEGGRNASAAAACRTAWARTGGWPLRHGRGDADEWARGHCVGFKPG
jgi:hypothetical protein